MFRAEAVDPVQMCKGWNPDVWSVIPGEILSSIIRYQMSIICGWRVSTEAKNGRIDEVGGLDTVLCCQGLLVSAYVGWSRRYQRVERVQEEHRER
jgi:hypothetical protein